MTACLPPPGGALAETRADGLPGLTRPDIPTSSRRSVALDLIDAAGLCIAAPGEAHMARASCGWDADGPGTALGHRRRLDAAGTGCAKGIAIQDAELDGTSDGAPIRVRSVTIRSAPAAAERLGLPGERALPGIVAGLESACRRNHTATGAIRRAGFHPVGVIGAAATAGRTPGRARTRQATAVGVAGCMASGIPVYLSEGVRPDRLLPGRAAQSGLRPGLLVCTGLLAPRSALDGPHGFFRALAPSPAPDSRHLTDPLGHGRHAPCIAGKPDACGNMIHPCLDCMIRLAATGLRAGEIRAVARPAGEGLRHRRRKPLAARHRPPSGNAARSAMPSGTAVGGFDGDAGPARFAGAPAVDAAAPSLADALSCVIDPASEPRRNRSGSIPVDRTDGRRIAPGRPHVRGGIREPLTDAESRARASARFHHPGRTDAQAQRLDDRAAQLSTHPDMTGLPAFAN